MTCRTWIVLVSTLLLSTDGWGQLHEINLAKLPQDDRVKVIYSSLLPIEALARDWTPTWSHDTPKEQVVSLLRSSLRDLSSAEVAAPENAELFLLTGLVAHLAYNVDVDNSYKTAVESLEKAHKLAPADYRADWFLGAHRCQSNDTKAGMDQLLGVEDHVPWQQLPVDFWDNYVSCSTLSSIPAHTLRAVDRAVSLGASSSNYSALVDIAQKRYKPSDTETTYPAHDAWRAAQGVGDVRFTSDLCGMGFSVHNNWHPDISDVTKWICTSMIETGPYPSKSGQGTPTLLVLSRTAKPTEGLDDFVQSFLKKYPSARPVASPACPSDKCLAFEIVASTMYQSEGGGHFLVVGFEGRPPEYPGLLFEKPDEPPKSKPGDRVTHYHPNERLRRLPGVLYTVVELDSNESIFERASADFQYLLKSIQLD